MQEVTLYADGACSPNPGPGGYGIVLVAGGQRREISGGFRRTTNNRMELISIISGLDAIRGKPCKVTIYSDSKYVVDNVESAKRWRAKGWRRDRKHAALNPDLWIRLLDLAGAHEASFVWVRGHSDNAGNERCDTLAVEARQKGDLPVDDGYENPKLPADPVHPTLFDCLGL